MYIGVVQDLYRFYRGYRGLQYIEIIQSLGKSAK